jgi:(E)-4-hydroxy-3-methyl-but-2-enyl pyrophosphate reductase
LFGEVRRLRIKVARTAGFCKGVKRAMNIVLDTANRKKENIFTYGPLIHNPQAVELLESKNVRIIRDMSDFSSGTVIIRTHGVGPEVKEKIRDSGANVCDATCPDVMKVQSLVRNHAEDGYTVIIVGDKGHPEVIAHLGFSSGRGIVIDSEEEVDQLPENGKVCVVAQTTFDYQRFGKIAERIKERFPLARVYQTVCNATAKRQEEILEMCAEVDCMVIVGGRNSGNTKRLVQIAQSTGTPVFHVETEEEIEEEKLARYHYIGISAGASTPQWLIQRVINRIENIREGKKRKASLITGTVKFLVKLNLYVALSAGALTYAASLLQGVSPQWETFFISGVYLFSMHVLNRFTDKTAGRFNDPERMVFYEKRSRVLITSAAASVVLSLLVAWTLGTVPFLILLFSCMMGIGYSMKIVPKNLTILKYKRLKDIPASKDFFIATAWAIVAVVLPLAAAEKGVTLATGITFFYCFAIAFMRATLFDLRDIQGDRIVGRETFPIIVGEERAEAVVKGLAVVMGLILTVSLAFHFIPAVGALFVLSLMYIFFYLQIFKKGFSTQRFTWEAAIDGNFILLGALTLIWHFLF